MEKNTENYLKYQRVVQEVKAGKASTKELIKLKRTLKHEGCYSKNPQHMRWRCMLADHRKEVQKYISMSPEEREHSSVRKFLLAFGLPTNYRTLKKYLTHIEEAAKKHCGNHHHSNNHNVVGSLEINPISDYQADILLYLDFKAT